MSDKPVRLLVAAQNELRQITAWYRDEAGEALALRWTDAVSSALRHIRAIPRTGSSRYALGLNLRGLRFWPISGFPYLIFYIERETQIDVWRVLHTQRDIPARMAGVENDSSEN